MQTIKVTPELKAVGQSLGFVGKFGFAAFICTSSSWITECFSAVKLHFSSPLFPLNCALGPVLVSVHN